MFSPRSSSEKDCEEKETIRFGSLGEAGTVGDLSRASLSSSTRNAKCFIYNPSFDRHSRMLWY